MLSVGFRRTPRKDTCGIRYRSSPNNNRREKKKNNGDGDKNPRAHKRTPHVSSCFYANIAITTRVYNMRVFRAPFPSKSVNFTAAVAVAGPIRLIERSSAQTSFGRRGVRFFVVARVRAAPETTSERYIIYTHTHSTYTYIR